MTDVMTATEPVTARPPTAAVVNIVLPVFNEAADLACSVERLRAYITERFPFTCLITIADNASTDRTAEIAADLSQKFPDVEYLHLDQKGRGRALRTAWAQSASPVVAYMDIDLSTDLDALLPMVASLTSGHSDIAIGSRLVAGATVARGPKREFISRSYNLMLRAMFATRVRDMQCGFKAARAEIVRDLLPAIEDEGWFFDTELLLLAERNGLRIHQVPVDWVDDPDSRVNISQTARDDMRGALRVARAFATGRGRVSLTHPRAVSDDDFGRRLVSFGVIRGAIGAIAAVAALCLTWAFARVMQFLLLNRTIPTRQVP